MIKMKQSRTTPELIVKFLPFSEKFTILGKGIANTFNIVLPLRNIGITAVLVAITLLNSSSTYIHPEFKVDVVVIDAGHANDITRVDQWIVTRAVVVAETLKSRSEARPGAVARGKDVDHPQAFAAK